MLYRVVSKMGIEDRNHKLIKNGVAAKTGG